MKNFKRIVALLSIIIVCMPLLAACNTSGDSIKVTFNPGFGLDSIIETASEDGKVDFPIDPKMSGYDFSGWFLSDNNGVGYTEQCSPSTVFTKDTTVYAKWTLITAKKGQVLPKLSPGMYDSEKTLTFDLADGDVLFYTTDGSDPVKLAKSGNYYSETGSTKWYNAGIPIRNRKNESGRLQDLVDSYKCYELQSGNSYGSGNPPNYNRGTVVKAVILSDDGNLSDVWTGSYFVWPNHKTEMDLPIMSLSTNIDNLFGATTGIYRNYTNENLAPIATIEYYDKDKNQIFFRDGTMKIAGAHHVRNPQKGFNINMNKGTYNAVVKYPMWNIKKNNKSDETLDKFLRFRLMSGGNDSVQGGFSDALSQKVFAGNEAETSAGVASALYLNGDYWGVYQIREHYTDRYFEDHYDVKRDNVLELKFASNCNGLPAIQEGPFTSYNDPQMKDLYWNMYEFARTNTTFTNEILAEFEEKYCNVDSMIDCYLSYIFAGNSDWPGNNNRIWRAIVPDKNGHPKADGRWNFQLHDFDMGFNGAYTDGITKNVLSALTGLTIETAAHRNTAWSTLYFRRCLTNANFKLRLLDRMLYFCNSVMDTERVNDIIDEFVSTLSVTRADYMARWKLNRQLSGGSVPVSGNLNNASWEAAYKTFGLQYPAKVMNWASTIFAQDRQMQNIITTNGPKLNGSNYSNASGVFDSDRNIVMPAVAANLASVDLVLETSDIANADYTMLKWGFSGSQTPPPVFGNGISAWHKPQTSRKLKMFTGTHVQLHNTSPKFVRYEITVAGSGMTSVTNLSHTLYIANSNAVTIKTIYS